MATRFVNPFQPATRVQKKAKVLVYGPPGSGKTVFALSFPGVAIIDMEGSADLYAGHKSPLTGGPLAFDVLRTKSLGDVQRVVDFIREDGGRTYQTLVIDPVTILDLILRGIGQKRAENRAAKWNKPVDEATMTDADWGAVKSKTYDLMTDLTNLPVNVVLTAHLKEEFETRRVEGREERVKTGVKPDAEKKTGHWAEFVFRMEVEKGKFVAFVDKQRGDYLKLGQRIPDLSYATLLPFIEAHATGQVVTQQRESDVARRDVGLLNENPPVQTTVTQPTNDHAPETVITTIPAPTPTVAEIAADIERRWTEQSKKARELGMDDWVSVFPRGQGKSVKWFQDELAHRYKLLQAERDRQADPVEDGELQPV